jgi:multiple sugar transport system ATP-binding protein
MARLELRNVLKSYGAVDVIKGIDLHVEQGEFCVFVGPSGCGKSTLLRMIAGLEPITGGEIAIGNEVVNAIPAADRGLAMVFQSYALYPHMTVRQNLSFGLENINTPKAEITAKVGEVAKMLQIDMLLDRRPKDLSGGQRQRVAIGRAVVREPAGLPLRRAAVEPRRRAARRHARRDQRAAQAPRQHHGLRHP